MTLFIFKVRKAWMWAVLSLAIAAMDSLANLLMVEEPVPRDMGAFRQLIGSFFELIYLITYIPVGIPRTEIIGILAAWFKISVYYGSPGYSDFRARLVDFVVDALVCYLYFSFAWVVSRICGDGVNS